VKAPSDEHLGETKNIVRAVAWLLVPMTAVGVLFLPSVIGQVLLAASIFAWAVFAFYLVLDRTLIRSAGKFAGHVLLPSGSSTPPAKGLSHIEAMVARGDLAKAALAYRAEILADPADLGSCERLATLAQRDLHDYDLAAWAYRQAEQRAESPGRKFGFGLLVAGVYRDNLKDYGRTVVELRRLVQLYPDAPRLDSLRAEIDELKEGIFDDHGA
jgi:hypothetical protein